MGFFIPADSSQPIVEVAPENGTDFKLAQLYTLLSCSTIEILPIADDIIMVLDEEGKLADKPRNERATRIANFVSPKQLVADILRTRETGVEVIRVGDQISDLMMETDYIAGDALICGDNEVR